MSCVRVCYVDVNVSNLNTSRPQGMFLLLICSLVLVLFLFLGHGLLSLSSPHRPSLSLGFLKFYARTVIINKVGVLLRLLLSETFEMSKLLAPPSCTCYVCVCPSSEVNCQKTSAAKLERQSRLNF